MNNIQNNTPALRFPPFTEGWVSKKLGEVTEKINSGKTPLGGESVYVEKGILFIRSQNVKDNILSYENSTYISNEINNTMKNSVVKPKDILLNITGASLGRSCVVPENFTIGNVNQHVCIIRIDKNNEPFFIQPILASEKGQNLFTSLQTGSGREGLNFQSIKGIEILFPTLPEQQKIAAFFTAIDKKLSHLKEKKTLLEQYKKGVMQQLFSQELRFKNTEGEDFVDWEVKKLGELCSLITKGTTPPKFSEINSEVNFIKIESISINGTIDISKTLKISNACHQSLLRSQLKKGDILFSIAGTLGRVAIINEKDLPANTNQALAIIRLINSEQLIFLKYFLATDYVIKYIESCTTVGAQPNINLQQVNEILVSLPSLAEQTQIAHFLSAIDKKIAQVAQQIADTEGWKKGLLQKMFV